MKMSIGNPRGVTLIEVLVTMTIGVAVLGGLSSQFIFSKKMTTYFDRVNGIEKIMSFVVSEVENIPFAELPAVGDCRVRQYSLEGALVKESGATVSECMSLGAPPGSYLVVWMVESQSTIDMTFSQPIFMKLPSGTEVIKPISIFGKFFDPRSRETKSQRMSLFRS